MSLDPINEGDLVMVIKPKPCCGAGVLGLPFTVEALAVGGYCWHCGKVDNEPCAKIPGQDGWVALSRLRKIHPSAETESVTEHEEIFA